MIKYILKLFFFIHSKLESEYYLIYNLIHLKKNNIKYLDLPKIHGKIIIKNKGTIIMGKNILINNFAKFNPVISHPTIISTLNKSAKIIISDNVGISGASIVAATSIIIGENVNIGGGVCIWDTDFHPVDPDSRRINKISAIKSKPIIIEEDVFIGARTIILKGVKVGKGSVIAAGSIVTKDILPNCLYAGNPAKKIKHIVK